MIKIVSNIIPFKGFVALTIAPFVFIRKDEKEKFDAVAENHEHIHCLQQTEMGFVGAILSVVLFFITLSWWSFLLVPIYFWWYIIEWILRSIFGTGNAYRNISFEREAYANEKDLEYNYYRDLFAWLRYMKRK